MNYVKNLAFRFVATIIISAITSAWVVYYVVDQSLTKSEGTLEATNQRIVNADQQISNNGTLLQQNADAISKLEMTISQKLQDVSVAMKDAQSGAITQDLTLRAMDANSALQLNMDFVNARFESWRLLQDPQSPDVQTMQKHLQDMQTSIDTFKDLNDKVSKLMLSGAATESTPTPTEGED